MATNSVRTRDASDDSIRFQPMERLTGLPVRARILFIFLLVASSAASGATATVPKLQYSTYLSGSQFSIITASTADANGFQYVAGVTLAADYPTTLGAYRRTASAASFSSTGFSTMFVAKLNPSASALVYSTFIATGAPTGIAVDPSGNVYVVGDSSGAEFPTTGNAWQTSCVQAQGLGCNFLVKLNPAGSGLIYSTFLDSAACDDAFKAIALDSTQHAYVAGVGGPGCYTTPSAYKRTIANITNALVMKIKSDGSGVLYSTYVGGDSSENDGAAAIAVDSTGHAIITGSTSSADFPTTPGAVQRTFMGGSTLLGNGPYDAFLTRLRYDGSSLLASTYIGGSGSDFGTAVAIDSANQIYIAGTTTSRDLSVTSNNVQPLPDPGTCDFEDGIAVPCADAFLMKLPVDFSQLAYSSYLGGPNGDESSVRLAIDSVGHAFIAASSTSTSVPLVKATSANGAMWLAELNAAGTKYNFSTRFGAGGTDNATQPNGVALDIAGNPYVSGSVSAFVPTTANAFQTTNPNNGWAGFVAKWDVPPCTLSNSDRTVTICAPVNGTTVAKQLLLAAGATDSNSVGGLKVYLDGTLVFSVAASHFNTDLTLTSGKHHITVAAFDGAGSFWKSIDVIAQ